MARSRFDPCLRLRWLSQPPRHAACRRWAPQAPVSPFQAVMGRWWLAAFLHRFAMLAFILRRLLQAVVVMTAVAFIAFMLFQYVGDPVYAMLGQDATAEDIAQLRAALGLDQPFFVQFWYFLLNAAQGQFGVSLRLGMPVSEAIGMRFPATLELALVAAVLAVIVGVPMGVFAALKRGSFMSQVFMTLSLLGVSLPTFLIGILLILVFSVYLGWFPSFGRGPVTDPP